MSPSHTSGVGEPIGARSGSAVEGSCEWWQLSSEANQIQFVFLLSKFVSDDFANPMILERYFRRQQLFASTVMWDVSFYEILMWDVYSHESLRGARCIYEKFSYHEQNFEVHLWECRPSRKFEMHLREYLPSRNCHKNLNLLRNSVNQSKKILYSLGVLSAGERYEFWFHANLWGYLDDAASPPFPPSPTRSKCQL
jgi:hypothetical protein